MGSIAQRATQFFENISKKKERVRPTLSIPSSCSMGDLQENMDDMASPGSLYFSDEPMTPNLDLEPQRNENVFQEFDQRIQHQGMGCKGVIRKRYSFVREWQICQIIFCVNCKRFICLVYG